MTASFSMKVFVSQYDPREFFLSRAVECNASDAKEAYLEAWEFCRDVVEEQAVAFALALGCPVPRTTLTPDGKPPLPPERGDASNGVFAAKARELNESAAEVNPFVVTAEPPPSSSLGPSTVVHSVAGTPSAPPAAGETQGIGSLSSVGTSAPADASFPPQPVEGDKPAAEPPTEPTRRRGRASAKEQAPATTSAAQTPATAYQASDDDVPEIIGAKESPLDQKARFSRITAAISGTEDRESDAWAAARKRIQSFLLVFLGVSKLPKTFPDPLYDKALPILEALARHKEAFLAGNIEEFATLCTDSYNRFVRYVDGWDKDTKYFAMAAAHEQYPAAMFDLIEFLDLAPTGGGQNLILFFVLVYRSKALAAKVREYANKSGTKTVELLKGLDFRTCSEGDILSRLVQVGQGEGKQ